MILSHGGIYTFKALPYITSTLSCLSFNTLIKCSRFLSISIHVKWPERLAIISLISHLPGPISTTLSVGFNSAESTNKFMMPLSTKKCWSK